MPRVAAHGPAGVLVVSGDHGHLEAHLFEGLHRLGGRVLRDIGQGDDAGHLSPLGHVDAGLGLRGKPRTRFSKAVEVQSRLLDQFLIAEKKRCAVEDGPCTETREGLETLDGLRTDSLVPRLFDNGPGKRMLR